MGKVGFLIKRIATLDYKNLMKTAGEVHEASGKSRISAFTDIVKCGMKYQAGYMDYKLFKMYELSDEERAKILTRGKNDAYVRRLNDKEYVGIFSDKADLISILISTFAVNGFCLMEIMKLISQNLFKIRNKL